MKWWPFSKKEERSTLAQPSQWFVQELAANPAASGATVNANTAMGATAVYAAVSLLARTVATLPLHTYERIDRGKRQARDHPLYTVLKNRPNPYQTSSEWRETMQAHLGLWGNAYSEIVFDGRGRAVQLWPLRPDRMKDIKIKADGSLEYIYQVNDGQLVTVPGRLIFHVKALSTDGLRGISPITQCREAIGLALAAQEYGARWFGNGARPSGVLQTPQKLSNEAHGRLKGSWNATYQGLTNANRVAILEEGLTYQQIGLPPEDSQFLETRQFQVAEVARIFNVPPHLIGDLSKATFSNIEHQSIDFLEHSVRPWLVKWEERILLSLFPEAEQGRYYAEFNVDGLLRGDIKSRYEAYSIGRQNGWLSADDIRERENMNPLDDGQGAIYLVPLNMVPADQAGKTTTEQGAGQAPGDTARYFDARETRDRKKTADGFRAAFEDAAARVVRRETEKIRSALKKHLAQRDRAGFETWMGQFYSQEFPEYLRVQMQPVVSSLAQAVSIQAAREIDYDKDFDPADNVQQYLEAYTARYTGSSQGQIKQLLDEDSPQEAIETRLGEWEDRRPGKVGMNETNQLSNYITLALWTVAGIALKRWAASSEACPICQEMHGKIVSIEGAFAKPGDIAGGMTFTREYGHPPLHNGCQCTVVPG